MKIYIKNMFCNGSKFFVKLELERLAIQHQSLELGEVEITDDISEEQLKQLDIALRSYRLELVDYSKSGLIKKIKTAINDLADNPEVEAKTKFNEYIGRKVSYSYSYSDLDAIFKEDTGSSIEKYFITKKIERAIELLVYYNLNLTEITYQLNYNSIAQLSNQFKMITGLTPVRFKRMKHKTNAANLKDIDPTKYYVMNMS